MNHFNKTGIITFHRSQNYGATFQVYALQKTLDQLGIQNFVIDYRNKKMEKVFKYQRNLIKAVIKYIQRAPVSYRKKYVFDQFIKENLRVTKKCNCKTIKNSYELKDFTGFITGSDQVFAYVFTDFDKNYFLDFTRDDQTRYSYAASFGSCVIPDKYKMEYSRLLSRFDEISVREVAGAGLVKELSGRNARVHIDPTLLLTGNDWHRICRSCKRKGFLFVYTIQEPVKLLKIALKLGEQHQLDIIYLGEKRYNKAGSFANNKRLQYISVLTPYEFLGYMEQAEYVLTNSFHGTIFSILFQKRFLVEPESQMETNTRILNLMKLLNIKDRSIEGNSCPDINQIPDWEKIELRLEELREQAFDYLKEVNEC